MLRGLSVTNRKARLVVFVLAVNLLLSLQSSGCLASDDIVKTVTFKTAFHTSVRVLNFTIPKQTLSYLESAPHPPALSDCSDSSCTMHFSHYVDSEMVTNISLSTASYAQLGEEDMADTILSFVQNIGYHMNNYTIRNTLYPAETLAYGGVCDDLSVLYASMMIAIGFRAIFIWYPQETDLGGSKVTHVNIGIHLTSRPEHSHEGAWSIKQNGLDYYVAETTNDHWRVGDMPQSLRGMTVYVEEAPAPVSTLVITRTATTSTIVLTATRTVTSTTTPYQVLTRGTGEFTNELMIIGGFILATIILVGIVAYEAGRHGALRAEAARPPQTSGGRYCRNCGCYLGYPVLYCSTCGTKQNHSPQ